MLRQHNRYCCAPVMPVNSIVILTAPCSVPYTKRDKRLKFRISKAMRKIMWRCMISRLPIAAAC